MGRSSCAFGFILLVKVRISYRLVRHITKASLQRTSLDLQFTTVHLEGTLSTSASTFSSLPSEAQSESVNLYMPYIEPLSA